MAAIYLSLIGKHVSCVVEFKLMAHKAINLFDLIINFGDKFSDIKRYKINLTVVKKNGNFLIF